MRKLKDVGPSAIIHLKERVAAVFFLRLAVVLVVLIKRIIHQLKHVVYRQAGVLCHHLLIVVVVDYKRLIRLLERVVPVFLIHLVVVVVVEQSLTAQLLKYAATEELKRDLDVNSIKLTHQKLTSLQKTLFRTNIFFSSMNNTSLLFFLFLDVFFFKTSQNSCVSLTNILMNNI